VPYKKSEYFRPMYDACSLWTIATASEVSAAMM
jgi:hypothetical protein